MGLRVRGCCKRRRRRTRRRKKRSRTRRMMTKKRVLRRRKWNQGSTVSEISIFRSINWFSLIRRTNPWILWPSEMTRHGISAGSQSKKWLKQGKKSRRNLSLVKGSSDSIYGQSPRSRRSSSAQIQSYSRQSKTWSKIRTWQQIINLANNWAKQALVLIKTLIKPNL